MTHNFQELATQLGSKDEQLAELVDSANANFEAIANQDQRLREALQLLPGTLDQTKTTLTSLGEFSGQLGPALSKLRPGARALGPSLRQSRPFLQRDHPGDRGAAAPLRARRAAHRARPAPRSGAPGGGHPAA